MSKVPVHCTFSIADLSSRHSLLHLNPANIAATCTVVMSQWAEWLQHPIRPIYESMNFIWETEPYSLNKVIRSLNTDRCTKGHHRLKPSQGFSFCPIPCKWHDEH